LFVVGRGLNNNWVDQRICLTVNKFNETKKIKRKEATEGKKREKMMQWVFKQM